MATIRFRNITLLAALAIPIAMAVGVAPAAQADSHSGPTKGATTRYVITEVSSLGGTSSSGSGVNDRGWVSGLSNLPGDQVTHATLWRHGSLVDLGTLGGPNSAILWPVKDNRGIVVGVAETADVQPQGELWSCSAFFPSATGHVCRGFVWRNGEMTALPTLGGANGFATAVNDRGIAVGWAETATEDPTCNPPQIFGFHAALWDTDHNRVQDLPPLPGDTASAATAINDRGQVVGISGICADAVGGFSARHAVLWDNGKPIDIGNFGGQAWNTAMAINDRGVVVGFANAAGTVGDTFDYRAFIWTKSTGFRSVPPVAGDTKSQALGVNDRGQVVGLSRGTGGARAFIRSNGATVDLNTLATGYPGRLISANDINDAGVITGQAIDAATGDAVAFVATPIVKLLRADMQCEVCRASGR